MRKYKNFLKDLVPPILLNWRNSLLASANEWKGNYASWDEAAKDCSGYDSKNIIAKVKESCLKVKNGEAVYERDSVLFDEKEYSWPLISTLLKVALEKKGKLSVLDFGGSLGSTYFQNLGFLNSISSLEWNIVEQKEFVKVGKESFEDNRLKFYHTIEECIEASFPDVILLSSVLQYLPEPYSYLERFIDMNASYLILERTAFSDSTKDLITIQKVDSKIYAASYPTIFFPLQKIMSLVGKKYDLDFEFKSFCDADLKLKKHNLLWRGLIFRKKNEQ